MQKDFLGTTVFLCLFGVLYATSWASAMTHAPEDFILGADVSLLKKVEDHGGTFSDEGEERDPLAILQDHGINTIRLKIWKDPVDVDGYNDLEETVEMARRVKEAGLDFLLNFHYSDFWADPGRQDKPAAWEDLSFDELVEAVYDHTVEVMTALREANALPDMVQVGNEIQGGMLWPEGKTWGDEPGVDYGGFDNLARLLRAGIDGVRDSVGDEDVRIILHLADGGDNDLYRWWFDEVTARGITDFDVIGVSFYPYWHGSLEDLQANLDDISQRYDKDVVVVETAYAFTLEDGDGHANIFDAEDAVLGGYPATVAGQRAFLKDILQVVRNVPNGRGLGIFYWEATWLPVEGAGWRSGEGNAWENQALFDFAGNALDSLSIFLEAFALPAAPTELNATEEDGQVTLSWTASDAPEATYNIYRAAGDRSPMDSLIVSSVRSTEFTDSFVSGGTSYTYAVRAVDGEGRESARSNLALASTPALEPAPAAEGATNQLFTYTPSEGAPAITSVHVAGEFNSWSTTAAPMLEQANGSWQLELPLEPGTYEYKFVFNGGQWPDNMCNDPVWGDPTADFWVDPDAERCQGGHNNAVVVVG